MYDPNGNPQRHVHGGSGAGELLYAYYAGTNKVSNTDGSGSDYRYDGNGNTTYSRSLDPAGSTTISYDVFSGLPTRVNAPDGAGGRTTTRYHYTSDGERVLKTGEARAIAYSLILSFRRPEGGEISPDASRARPRSGRFLACARNDKD